MKKIIITILSILLFVQLVSAFSVSRDISGQSVTLNVIGTGSTNYGIEEQLPSSCSASISTSGCNYLSSMNQVRCIFLDNSNRNIPYTVSCSSGNIYGIAEYGLSGGGTSSITITGDTQISSAVTCTDSDGWNYDNKGYTSGSLGTKYDYCVGTTLVEQVCDGNLQEEATYTCPSGKTCNDGRCQTEAPPNDDYCTDSDNGVNYNVQGTVNNKISGVTASNSDSCNGDVLTEYSCNTDKTIKSQTYTCPNGCLNGKCVACSPETNTVFCSRLGYNCGSITQNDNCGTIRTVNCGTCQSEFTCINNVCVEDGCVDETDQQFCSRLSKECSYIGTNNCGVIKTVNCGTCVSGLSCVSGECKDVPTTCDFTKFPQKQVYELVNITDCEDARMYGWLAIIGGIILIIILVK